MNRPSAAVKVSFASGVLAALVLAASGAPPVTLSAPPVVKAGERVYKAGMNPAPEFEPEAAVDASVADLPAADNQDGYAHQAAALPGAYPGIKWTNVGPMGQDDPADYPTGTVRFARGAGMGAAVAVDPRDTTGDTFYVGNMGGLWHTTDGGKTWKNLVDGKLTRTAVGAIALDPKDPDTIYVGTGIGFLTISGDAPGSGIWVSHDAGATFHRSSPNIRGYAVNAIAVTDDGVLAATSNGLYVSTNDGASFTRLAVNNNAGHDAPAVGAYANWFSAIAVDPLDQKNVIVAVGMGLGKKPGPDGKPLSPGNGLYKSTTGVGGPYTFMASTTQLTHQAATNDPVGRIMMSWVKDPSGDTTVLWVLVSDAGLASGHQPSGDVGDTISSTTGQSLNRTGTELNGLYRSDDSGGTFNVKATPQSLAASPNEGLGVYPALGYGVGVQAYYNLWVQGDPVHADQVYFGLEEVFQSISGTGSGPGLGSYEVVQRYWDVCGSTTYFDNITKGVSCPDSTPYYGGVSTHPDQHVGLVFQTDDGLRLYTGNDGGFFREDSHALTDGRNGFDNDSWTDMNYLASVQPWKIARKPDGEYLTALQDNGAGFFAPGKTNTLVSSGDGVNVLATSDPDVWYMSAQGAAMYVTTDHGLNIKAIPADLTGATFLSPMAIDPTDDNHLIVSGQNIKETTKGAATTTTYDPVSGTVVSTDWTEVFDAGKSPVGAKPAFQAQAAALRDVYGYVAVCGLCRNSLGDPTLIYSTLATNVKPGCEAQKMKTDCWHLAAGIGLPHVAIWNLAIDPLDAKTVYVVLNSNSLIGLDEKVAGKQKVMVSHDGGDHFTDITGNLPHSNARDLVVRGSNLIVATDNGVFIGPKTGGAWMRLGYGLPQTRVTDLDLDSTGRYLTAGVFGRGVWSLDFKATSSSSSGPGPKGEPKKPATGKGLPATGANAALGLLALVACGAAAVARRARRSAES